MLACRALAAQRHLEHMQEDLQGREARAQQAREAALQQGAPPKRQHTCKEQAAFLKRLAAQKEKSTAIKCELWCPDRSQGARLARQTAPAVTSPALQARTQQL